MLPPESHQETLELGLEDLQTLLWAPPEREVLGYEACDDFLFPAL